MSNLINTVLTINNILTTSIQYTLFTKIYQTTLGYTPNNNSYTIILTYDQVYNISALNPSMEGYIQFNNTVYHYFIDTTIGAGVLRLDPVYPSTEYGVHNIYKLIPPTLDHQRNALRIEFIAPVVRCTLKPANDTARRMYGERGALLRDWWGYFGYCTPCGSNSCATCPVAQRKAG